MAVGEAPGPGERGDRGELVTVARLPGLAAAQAARARLAAEGIQALVLEQDAFRFSFLPAGARSGVRLQVRVGDAPRARRILAADETNV